MIQKKEWNNFFKDNVHTEWYPSEAVVRLVCSYQKKNGSAGKKFLDLGCGNGRHVNFAAQKGFSVYGIDLSDKAIALAKEWLKKDNLHAEDLQSQNIAERLPYPNNFFDIVISYGVLDHMQLPDAQKAVKEVGRVLKPGGVFLLKLESNTSHMFDPRQQYVKNEVILEKETERGMIQHFFDKDEVVELTKNFKCIKAYRDDHRHFDDLNKYYMSQWFFLGEKP